jgi:hypothetical protein
MTDYMKEMEEHWKRINKQGGDDTYHTVTCPSTWGRPCKLCDLAKAILFNKKDYPEEHPLRKKARELNRKNLYYSNIILLQSPFDIVVFEYGDKIFKRLLRFQMDPEFGDYKDFMHPVNGFNMIIDKIPAADKRQTDYAVEPRRASSTLPNAEALLKAIQDPRFNLTEIVNNNLNGLVKPFNQKKLPNGKTEIRILPSWLGPKYMGKFFQHVLVHYNITQEDYDKVAAGALNPFTDAPAQAYQTVTTAAVPTTPTPTVPTEDWGIAWNVKPAPAAKVEAPPTQLQGYSMPKDADLPDMTSDGGSPPMCFGDYDQTDPECTGACTNDGWGAQCKTGWEERKSRRQGAKNITPRKL